MILPILISFLVGVASGFTGQVLADKVKGADPIVVCVVKDEGKLTKCQKDSK